MGLSNATLSLLIALASVLTLLANVVASQLRHYFPLEEVHVSGHFDTSTGELSLNLYNYGDVAANLASNIHCIFGLENAISAGKTEEGVEVVFWTTSKKIVAPQENLQVRYAPQAPAVTLGEEQVLCFSALSYLGRRTQLESYLLTIVPTDNSRWWAVETMPTEPEVIERLYPREISLEEIE